MVVILFKYGGGNKGVMGRYPTDSHDFYNSPYHNGGGEGIPLKMVPNFIILRKGYFFSPRAYVIYRYIHNEKCCYR